MEKSLFKRVWDFLWVSESLISWIVLLLLFFVVIMFLFFPFSRLAFSTHLPYVVVESGSMTHNADFDGWWQKFGIWYEQHNITKEAIADYPFSNGINIGDIIIVKGNTEYKIGDVIVFDAGAAKPIIHRVIKIYEDGNFSTKGDNNAEQLPEEIIVQKNRVLGKSIGKIPKLGWVKLAPCSVLPQFCILVDRIRG